MRPGERLILTRYWEVLPGTTSLGDITVETPVLPSSPTLDPPPVADQQIVLRDRPCHGSCSSSMWHDGEVVTDTYAPPIPETLRAGAYSLTLGVCDDKGTWLSPGSGALAPRAFLGYVEIYAAP